MKNSALYYSVGPLLYCPANNPTIAGSIINQRFGTGFSLALCLEDTIADAFVPQAECQLAQSLERIYDASKERPFYLPKIFIRVRSHAQMLRLATSLQNVNAILFGFILPKFTPENAERYIPSIIQIKERFGRPVYVMPIFEHAWLTDLRRRHDILFTLKEKLADIEPLVLNIRVGGNDLCHLYGFRRHDTESIHQIAPIASIFSDIITCYGTDYVVSGPVWEYYNGNNWREGLQKELLDDRLCGFTGKTVIHPKQIAPVIDCYRVPASDLADAKAILNWDASSPSLVSGNTAHERMNEQKTHFNWAMRTVFLAEAYGTVPASG